MRWSWFLFALGAGSFACSAPEPASLASSEQAVIYGNDDRQNLYELESATLRDLALESSVAIIPRALLKSDASGTHLAAETLGERFGLCGDQAFVNEPSAARCSGVLVAADLVLTAGHCFGDTERCSDFAFVFGYALSGPGTLAPLSTDSVYACRRLLLHSVSRGLDVAVVELARPVVSPRAPATLSAAHALDPTESYVAIGAGWGLPTKIDAQLHVLDARAKSMDYALLSADSFQGNSGAGVFDDAGHLVAYLTGGEADLAFTERGCNVAQHRRDDCADCLSGGERATYLADVLKLLCGQRPAAPFCGVLVCGDGSCESAETPAACPADCEDSRCGDGVCQPAERVRGCVVDCGEQAPLIGAPAGTTRVGACSVSAPLGSEAALARWVYVFISVVGALRRRVSSVPHGEGPRGRAASSQRERTRAGFCPPRRQATARPPADRHHKTRSQADH